MKPPLTTAIRQGLTELSIPLQAWQGNFAEELGQTGFSSHTSASRYEGNVAPNAANKQIQQCKTLTLLR